MPFEQFNDSYLKNILQNLENLNKAYTFAFSKISEQISGIDQRFTGKSWKDLSDKFKWLGLNHAPIKEDHFRLLHHLLLKEAESFLEKILEKLM
ncbi:hypothetical protein LC612_14965 [Nostoc sp. CHAB 5834]|nr:hypothetical protein [Nostoc sp. CHAB 5834]